MTDDTRLNDEVRAALERVTGILWDATKPDEMPLWWCLNADRKKWFRASPQEPPPAEVVEGEGMRR